MTPQVGRPKQCSAPLLIDLDFRAINGSLGYAASDAVLGAVARLLQATAPPGATVAHLGGDTFAILLHHPAAVLGAAELARLITERLREPLARNGGTVHVRASIGVVGAPPAAAEVVEILRDADSALNLAKVGGGNRCVDFLPAMRPPGLRRFHLEQDLVEALREGAL